eukprot:TRINITY_DN4887_c0_g3_i4.p1 TRINITY_DN4887_c0_g3~~TRINITY_DN4887_c0_g3_i4.p1  ORF type:complete len:196 (+),score=27.02 TRINITY_DN4887_c0_g3_i4:526-1113(+)
MYQLALGVDFCHSHRIFHRDLKPQNLLIDEYWNLKIADFGLARTFTLPIRPYSREVITLWYRPPELLLGSNRYATSVDMWSVGCIYFELLTRRVLFPGDSQIDQLFKIFQVLGVPDEEGWPGVTQLPEYRNIFPNWRPMDLHNTYPTVPVEYRQMIASLLVCNPALRQSAKGILQDPQFANFVGRDLSDITLNPS